MSTPLGTLTMVLAAALGSIGNHPSRLRTATSWQARRPSPATPPSNCPVPGHAVPLNVIHNQNLDRVGSKMCPVSGTGPPGRVPLCCQLKPYRSGRNTAGQTGLPAPASAPKAPASASCWVKANKCALADLYGGNRCEPGG